MAGGAENVETGPEREVAKPSMREVLETLKLMGAHMVTLTQAFTPLVNSSVDQVTPPVRVAPRAAGERLRTVAEVVELDPPDRVVRKVDYLKVLEHISKLGTKHFAGSVDPIEADEWRSRLVRNFSSTRCHEVEFNHKYFPAEEWDRLESKFLDLSQGRKTVREYGEEFNRLRRYVGKELEDEAV